MATARRRQASDQGPEFFYVRSNLDENRVALHEVDAKHPGGSVIVAGNTPVKVGNTKFVRDRLRDGFLVEVSGDKATRMADKAAAERDEMYPNASDDWEWNEENENDEPAEPNRLGGNYSNFTNAELEDEARARGMEVKAGANKGDLVAMLQKHDQESKVNG